MLRWMGLLFITLCCVSAAAQSGLLLGVELSQSEATRYEDFGEAYLLKYETWWIAPGPNGDFQIAAKLPDVVVPRKDGFWHVGVTAVCEFDGKNESLRQYIWKAPVGQAGLVTHAPLCTPHAAEDYAPLEMRSEADADKLSQCGYNNTSLTFVSPALIAFHVMSSQSDDCEARGGHYEENDVVRTFDSEKPISFRGFFGTSALSAYLQALPKNAETDAETECGESRDDPEEESTDQEWTITRVKDRWALRAVQHLGYFGCMAQGTVKMALPVSISGPDVRALNWSVIAKAVKDLKAAFSSPDGSLVVAITGDGLSVYSVSRGSLRKRLLNTPFVGRVVSAQWSTGTHVADWTAQLTALQRKRLPPPFLKLDEHH